MARTRLHRGLLPGLIGLVLTAALTAPPATADPAPAEPTLVGDVTGDGLPDSTVLTNTGTSQKAVCVALVRAGRADGTWAPARSVVLPVPANSQRPDGFQRCPVDGVVLRNDRPTANRLAVVYDPVVGAGRGVDVFTLVGARTVTGRAGWVTNFAGYGETYGAVDLDGRGADDWWASTSDGPAGGRLFTRSGATWQLTYSTGYARAPSFTFVDLDRGRGTDALVTTVTNGSNHPIAAAVDGRTGRVQVLVTGDPFGQPAVVAFRVATVAADGDAYPDVVTTPVLLDGTPAAPTTFLNRSQHGRWQFVAA